MLFGNIVKVTPSSKVVGDMALIMVAQDLAPSDMIDPTQGIAFPAWVVEMLRGDLGQPSGGWPEDISKRVLGDEQPYTARLGSLMQPTDLAAMRKTAEEQWGSALIENESASYLMYPKIFAGFAEAQRQYGPVAALRTPIYFCSMAAGEDITVEIDQGKSLVVTLQAIGDTEEDGRCDDSGCERRLREFQDSIFQRRTSNPLLLPFVYHLLRSELELDLTLGAAEFLRQAGIAEVDQS